MKNANKLLVALLLTAFVVPAAFAKWPSNAGTYPGSTYPGETYPSATYPSDTYPSGTYSDTVGSQAVQAMENDGVKFPEITVEGKTYVISSASYDKKEKAWKYWFNDVIDENGNISKSKDRYVFVMISSENPVKREAARLDELKKGASDISFSSIVYQNAAATELLAATAVQYDSDPYWIYDTIRITYNAQTGNYIHVDYSKHMGDPRKGAAPKAKQATSVEFLNMYDMMYLAKSMKIPPVSAFPEQVYNNGR